MGDWVKPQPEKNVTTVYEGIRNIGKEKGFSVNYFNSGESIRDISDKNINETVEYVKNNKPDLIVVVVGDNSMRDLHGQKTAGENMARADINLAGNQLQLIKSLYKTNIPIILF